MNLSDADNKLIDALLKHDLNVFASKLGYVNESAAPLSDELAIKLLNLAERISRRGTTGELQNRCLLICGLLWEHRSPNWKALPSVLIQILGRLGLVPTAKMVDSGFNFENDTFSGLGSLLAELKFTSHLIKGEVEVIPGHRISLTMFQKKMWDAIDEHKRIGISAPTSAGKSFILVNKIINLLSKQNGDVVYIVPTITLINQVTNDLRKTIKKLNIQGFNISQTYSDKKIHHSERNVYVLTQERALSALNQSDESFKNLSLLIIDEVQNIERVANEDNERSQDLYNTIQEFETRINPEKIIVAGPRVKNIDKLVKKLFGENAQYLPDELPPVLNLTYSFKKSKGKVFLRQFSSINKYPQSIEIENLQKIDENIFGKSQYTDGSHQFISNILTVLSKDSGTIIFSPTKSQANASAQGIASFAPQPNDVKLKSLVDYIKDTVHPNYTLIKSVEKGVAYHHADVPYHLRIVVEQAFSLQVIKSIICTTTLMQGVNLPAKNLIARNPNLFIRKTDKTTKLTPYEFANLRGRAGRLMKDFVGRAIILDESAFEEEQGELFEYPEKDVAVGYGKRFSKNKKEIVKSLLNGDQPSNDTKDFNDLTIYIRQTILKHKAGAIERLRKADIEISEGEYLQIFDQLQKLEVPTSICKSNLHWDPFVLNDLFKFFSKANYTVPETPFADDYVSSLSSVLLKVNELNPYYFKKYFDFADEKVITKILITAQRWSKEQPLKEIISWRSDIDAKEVDNILGFTNKVVPYSIPKLLRPVIQMLTDENPVLGFMEVGAFKNETRRLIEFGIPREVAIRISDLLNKKGLKIPDGTDVTDKTLINNYINKVIEDLNYWDRISIESSLS
ncbi:MAG: DEAD/DEAH box helicase [Bacteroidia bacterium]